MPQCSESHIPIGGNMTLREYIEYAWLPYLKRRAVKPSTLYSYHSMLKNHIYPTLGDSTIEAAIFGTS